MLWEHFLLVCNFLSSQQCHCRVENFSEVISEFTPLLVCPFFTKVNVEWASSSVTSLDVVQLELIFMTSAVCLDSFFMCRCPFLSTSLVDKTFTLFTLFNSIVLVSLEKMPQRNNTVAQYFRVVLCDLVYWTYCFPHSTFLQFYS